jgi:plasmid stabilization system protein ParE
LSVHLQVTAHISEDSFDAADRVLEDFYSAFGQLGEMPGMRHRREDLTLLTAGAPAKAGAYILGPHFGQ